MRIQFNTGRSYTEVGQRVVAQTAKGYFGKCSGIRFHDIDRGCCGVIPVVSWMRELSAYDMERFVMANYDAGNYEGAACGDLQWED